MRVGNVGHAIEQLLFVRPDCGVGIGGFFGGVREAFGLGGFLGLHLLVRPLGAIIVRIRCSGEEFVLGRRLFGGFLVVSRPVAFHRLTMHLQAAGERLDGGQQALLQADDQQAGGGLRPFRRLGVALFAGRAVLVEQPGKDQLGRVVRQTVDADGHDVALRESALHLADVLLQPAHHHAF